MAWITDGSDGFTVDGNVVSHTLDELTCNVFNAMWQDGEGVSVGEHYWKIHFLSLGGGAGVGLTSRRHFNKGYACKAIEYLGNLSDGSTLLANDFGPIPEEGDTIGIMAAFVGDTLKMYLDINGKSLGLAFIVPASTFGPIFPMVFFQTSGSASCAKQSVIPDLTRRSILTFSGIEGNWGLTNLRENGVAVRITRSVSVQIKQVDTDKYSMCGGILNRLQAELSKVDGVWKTSPVRSDANDYYCESVKFEHTVRGLIMGNINCVELDESGKLSIKSDTISTTWYRCDPAPRPYVGDPFKRQSK